VAADLLRSESRHQPDDETAGDRRQQDEQRLVVPGARRHEACVDPLVEDEVGDQSDQSQQGQGGDRPGRSDRHRPGGDGEHAAAEREVAQVLDALSHGRAQRIR
jgi:hypothetical protein